MIGSIMKFMQYDVVKIVAFNVQQATFSDAFNLRRPAIADVAIIIEIYSSPPGYELECSDAHGITQWLVAFRPEDVVLELHR